MRSFTLAGLFALVFLVTPELHAKKLRTPEEAQAAFSEVMHAYEQDLALQTIDITKKIWIVADAGEPGQKLMAEFLAKNIEYPLDPQTRPDAESNSLRFHLLTHLRDLQTPTSEAAMALVVQTSPNLKETLEAALALESWGLTQHQETSRKALQDRITHALANLPDPWIERSPVLGQVVCATVMFDLGKVPAQVWTEFQKLNPRRVHAWARVFADLPPDKQALVLTEMAGKDHQLELIGEVCVGWDFSNATVVDNAFYIFKNLLDKNERVSFLKADNPYQKATVIPTADGRSGSSRNRRYLSEADHTHFQARLKGAQEIYKRIGTLALSDTEKMLLAARVQELQEVMKTSPDWEMAGEEKVEKAAENAPPAAGVVAATAPGAVDPTLRQKFEAMLQVIESGKPLLRAEFTAWFEEIRKDPVQSSILINEYFQRNEDWLLNYKDLYLYGVLERSLRFTFIEELATRSLIAESRDALLTVVDNSASLREVLEAGFGLENQRPGKFRAQVVIAVAELAPETLANLPPVDDTSERMKAISYVAIANYCFGEGELLPQVWAQFAALREPPENSPWGRVFAGLTGQQQVEILASIEGNDQALDLLSLPHWIGRWDFAQPRVVQVAFRGFQRLKDPVERERYLGSQHFSSPRLLSRFTSNGTKSISNREYFRSEAEREYALQRMAGAEALLQQIMALQLQPNEITEAELRLAEVRKSQAEFPNWKLRP